MAKASKEELRQVGEQLFHAGEADYYGGGKRSFSIDPELLDKLLADARALVVAEEKMARVTWCEDCGEYPALCRHVTPKPLCMGCIDKEAPKGED